VAPASWDHGTRLGSHQAAVMAARVSLLAAIMREPSVGWVSTVDRLYAAENKIIQYRAAMVAGLRVPRTLVAIDRDELADELGEPFVLKPLGPGNFEADGRQYVSYVTSRRAADLAEADLLSAPFLAQSVVTARKHLRIVTVDQDAWVAELDANELPLDWRSHGPAHSSFRAARWPGTQADAVRLASSLDIGFSCQDWVVDEDGPVFLDLNPGGQWLFLPEAVSFPATRALAGWLTRR
jgi:glutathione synthase/RimK-type ligase-like ATP-grasp enzyme